LGLTFFYKKGGKTLVKDKRAHFKEDLSRKKARERLQKEEEIGGGGGGSKKKTLEMATAC